MNYNDWMNLSLAQLMEHYYCVCMCVCVRSVSRLVKANLVEDSLQVIKKCNEASQEQLPQIIACSPVSVPALIMC